MCTFSIWSASRRSLASLRLGLNVSGSSSVLLDAPCLEFTSSLVVIYKYKIKKLDIHTLTLVGFKCTYTHITTCFTPHQATGAGMATESTTEAS